MDDGKVEIDANAGNRHCADGMNQILDAVQKMGEGEIDPAATTNQMVFSAAEFIQEMIPKCNQRMLATFLGVMLGYEAAALEKHHNVDEAEIVDEMVATLYAAIRTTIPRAKAMLKEIDKVAQQSVH